MKDAEDRGQSNTEQQSESSGVHLRQIEEKWGIDCTAPLPAIGQLLVIDATQWLCVKCRRRNSGNTVQCACGYRELFLSPSYLHSKWLAAISQTSAQIYWQCACGFQYNLHKSEACGKCRAVSWTKRSELRAIRIEKELGKCEVM